MPERPVRILHAHSTFSLGGKEARAVRLMNAFGDAAEHVVLSATGQLAAREAIDPAIRVEFPEDAPSLVGKPAVGRYRRLTRYMRQFDLVLSYNWGAMDAVGARRLFGGPPLIHHEDGFNEDEAVRQKPARILFRRAMLPAARQLVVPSATLETVALGTWHQPRGRVVRIANGIPVNRYGAPPAPDAIPGLERRPGEIVIGTVAGLRAVKNLPRLLHLFARALPERGRLVVVGEGPERENLLRLAAGLGIADRLVMPGFLPDPSRYIGHFDAFALTSDSEQFPIALVEAMAAGLFCIATAVGDVPHMLPPGNAVADPHDQDRLLGGFRLLLESPEEARAVGALNQAKAQAEYDEHVMISRYRALYGEAIGRPDAFQGAATGSLPRE